MNTKKKYEYLEQCKELSKGFLEGGSIRAPDLGEARAMGLWVWAAFVALVNRITSFPFLFLLSVP